MSLVIPDKTLGEGLLATEYNLTALTANSGIAYKFTLSENMTEGDPFVIFLDGSDVKIKIADGEVDGILQESGTTGQEKIGVLINGISSIHSGLTSFGNYYLGDTVEELPTSYGEVVDQWNNPQRALLDDGNAAATFTVNYEEDYGDFGFTPTSNVKKIEVTLNCSYGTAIPAIQVYYSINGGTSWTSIGTITCPSVAGDESLTATVDLTPTETNDTNFKIKIKRIAASGTSLLLYYVKCKILTYDGGITTDDLSGLKIGRALSTTDLWLTKDF